MLAVILVYAGFVAALTGIVAIIRPIKILRLGTRVRGAALLAGGAVLTLIGMALPASEVKTAASRSRLDELVPNYQFYERHSIRIQAPPDQVYRAVRQVTAGEITFFRALTWVRRFGRRGPESILNAPERMPLLEVATRSGFISLADDPHREIVIGTIVIAPRAATARPQSTEAFRRMTEPGYAKAAMNFLIAPNDSTSTLLTTETRVYAADARTQRRFARYWRVIYPGSALIRRSWLRAVRRRVEKT